MIARYRLVEDWLAEEGYWLPWGVFYENCSGNYADYTLLIRAIPDDDRRKGHYFDQRIQELRPSIEEAEVVLGEYADRYRALPEIHIVEGADYREIRARLWEIIFEEIEKRRAERHLAYPTLQPAYRAVREQPDETNSQD